MAKVSIMTMVFGHPLEDGTLTDAAMLESLQQMGFDGVELPARHLIGEPKRLKKYATLLADSPLRVTCIDASCNFIAPDEATRSMGVDAVHAAIELAWAFGCSLVLAAGSHLSAGIAPDDGRRMITEGLQACLSAARQADVTLAIEDFGVAPTLQCAARDCLEILEAAPEVGFVFDTGNFYFCGEDPIANLELLGERTVHVHLKDWVKSERPEIADVAGAPLGTGLIPNEELVRRFLDPGHVDSFSLEVGAPGDKLQAARRDIETLRGWLESQRTESGPTPEAP
jgi:sugar phosphate isomerase/epimerase